MFLVKLISLYEALVGNEGDSVVRKTQQRVL